MSPSVYRPPSTVHRHLVSYFRSGWAFLIPYLAAYLLYAWLKWPVNPVNGGQWTVVPCLLHLYWFLHGLHLILGGVALLSWWRNSGATDDGDNSADRATSLHPFTVPLSGHRPPSAFDRLWPLLPWLCLALLFWIPGVYMEFPADPWQHYARMNEWVWLRTVTEHSYWAKSSYFLAYSLLGRVTPPLVQLRWFDVFYTGCCLLLCWQYFRLARAIGLGAHTSILFVLLQAVLFGNFIFGFYRYYGMSSSVFAQLGAIALTRIVLECANGSLAQGNGRSLIHRILLPFVSCSLLLTFTAFNHIQGIGIAAFGIAAVIVWRLIEWKRAMVGWLALLALVLSIAAILWYPRNPLLDSYYRPDGWLTPWYGFNLFQPSSVLQEPFDRTIAIYGAIGVLNFIAGLFLLWRNQVAGWLTVMPALLLSLPFVAVPFASVLAADKVMPGGYIIAFPRMLFAIPPGLALVAALGRRKQGAGSKENEGTSVQEPPSADLSSLNKHRLGRIEQRHISFPLLLAALAAFTTLPAGRPYYNRMYNILMVPADDLSMRDVIGSASFVKPAGKILPALPALKLEDLLVERGGILTTPGIGFVLNATGRTLISNVRKQIGYPAAYTPSASTIQALENLLYVDQRKVRVLPIWPVPALISPGSQTGFLSQHWLPDEVALVHATQSEIVHLKARARPSGFSHAPQIWLEWRGLQHQKLLSKNDPGFKGEFQPVDDRGLLHSDSTIHIVQAGDELELRCLMRTQDGNGWRVALKVQGPGGLKYREYTRVPTPLGGASWISGEDRFSFTLPGSYILEVAGTTLWPIQTNTLRYRIFVQTR